MIRPEIQKIIDDLKNNPEKWSMIGDCFTRRLGEAYDDNIRLANMGGSWQILLIPMHPHEIEALSYAVNPLYNDYVKKAKEQLNNTRWEILKKATSKL